MDETFHGAGLPPRPNVARKAVVPPSPPAKDLLTVPTPSRPGTSASRPGASASRPGTSDTARTGRSAWSARSAKSIKSARTFFGLPAGPKKPPPPLTVDTWKTSQAPPTRVELQRSLILPVLPPVPIAAPTVQFPTEERRPMTASTKRLSLGSSAASRRRIQYGTGKYAMTELVPQPSDDPADPLRWPRWKKELNLAALLLAVSLVNVMKTAFLSVNTVLALNYAVSYTAAVALTGVPLIVAAASGLLSQSVARIWGKRPVYLASWGLIFIGAVWNTNVLNSYGQCMAARIFQAIGWGAFDVLVLGSIYDTFYEHERTTRLAIYRIVAVTTTWGPPLIGGVASQGSRSFGLQYVIIAIFFIPATLLLALAVPESVFTRSYNWAQTPHTGATTASRYQRSMKLRPRGQLSMDAVRDYLATVKPFAYTDGRIDAPTLVQASRSLLAPTTLLIVAVTFLPLVALWGLASSLSLFFSTLPWLAEPSEIGTLMTGPWLLATIPVAVFALYAAWQRNFTSTSNALALGAGSALVFIGLLAFGLYLDTQMTLPGNRASMQFALNFAGGSVSFAALSFVLGLLAAGAYILEAATVAPLINRSTQFTSSNLGVAYRCTADMEAGVAIWRSLLAGIFVIALPNAVWYWDGLKGACVGIAVAQVVVAGAVAAVWWFYEEYVRRLDGRVLGCVDLNMLKQQGSFFDAD